MIRTLRSTAVLSKKLTPRSFSVWDAIPMAPPDKIFGLTVAYQNDPAPNKINLGVGAYRDDNGKPFVLESVQEAERRILSRHSNHEYSAIQGNDVFIKLSEEFTFGEDSPLLKEKRVASIQSLSGTGSLRVIAECFSAAKGDATTSPKIYLPNPTWANHMNIFRKGGMEPLSYGYYDDDLSRFNVNLMLADLEKVEDESIFCFHASSHNPTGSDPSIEEWDLISEKVKQKKHVILFDNAYQGYASGHSERGKEVFN
jgi:aspartate aminotransferase, mitochondrial